MGKPDFRALRPKEVETYGTNAEYEEYRRYWAELFDVYQSYEENRENYHELFFLNRLEVGCPLFRKMRPKCRRKQLSNFSYAKTLTRDFPGFLGSICVLDVKIFGHPSSKLLTEWLDKTSIKLWKRYEIRSKRNGKLLKKNKKISADYLFQYFGKIKLFKYFQL